MSQLSDSYYVEDESGKGRPFEAKLMEQNGTTYLGINYGVKGAPPIGSGTYTSLNLNGDDAKIAQTIAANKLLFQELIKSLGNLDLSLGVPDLKERIKERDDAFQKLEKDVQALQTEFNEKVLEADTKLKEAKDTAAAATAAATASTTATESALNDEIAQLKAALSAEKAALVQAKSEHEQELQKERNDTNDLANTLRDEISAAKKEIQQLQLEIQQLKQSKDQANNTLLERDAEIQQLKAKLTTLGQSNGASKNDDNNTTPVPPPVSVSTTTPSVEDWKKASDLRQEAKKQLIKAINAKADKEFSSLTNQERTNALKVLQGIPKSVIKTLPTKKINATGKTDELIFHLKNALGDEIYEELEKYTQVPPENINPTFGMEVDESKNNDAKGGDNNDPPPPSPDTADTNATNDGNGGGGSADDVASVKKYIEITNNLSDEEKNKLEKIWKTQIPKIPMQYASEWVTAKKKNPNLTAAEFAESMKGEFVDAGVVFYFEFNNQILVSANVDVNKQGNLEIYNLTKTESATEPYSATKFINFVYDTLFKEDGSKSDSKFYNTVFKTAKDDTQLFLKPANGKIKELYDDMVNNGKISKHILVGDNEHSKMPYDFRFNKGTDVDNPILLEMKVSTAKKIPTKGNLKPFVPFFVWKDDVYKVTQDSDGTFSAQKVNNASEWLSKGWYNPKNPNPK